MIVMENDELTEKIIGACYKVHNELGPGFIEKVYQNALELILREEKVKYEAQKSFSVKFKEEIVGTFRVDLLIEDKIILELKAVTGLMPKVFETQTISYLKASGLKVALLVNFDDRKCYVRRIMN
ncbi:MAG: GxxExxY protein [Candidatus Omnitrophica bacterium CG07_land_8_20_14_0_80_42_15]|uniref:GxxExxY protein n=1 Tax=Candidatus Aquitaenariimonas noxiae TaxID=1974741 RepID=A0A2J0KQX8_9BACT|nr:MAG: GxxExxY protein [Candidatus Omnitrophica bacterium CG07_land_8_20_14_0_80_42_15]